MHAALGFQDLFAGRDTDDATAAASLHAMAVGRIIAYVDAHAKGG